MKSLGQTVLAGSLSAAGLTAAIGVGLPILLLPGQTLAPIVGLIAAPPAFLLGVVLGWIVFRWAKSYPSAAMVGCVTGAIVGAAVVLIFQSGQPMTRSLMILYLGLGSFVFGVTGAVAHRANRRER